MSSKTKRKRYGMYLPKGDWQLIGEALRVFEYLHEGKTPRGKRALRLEAKVAQRFGRGHTMVDEKGKIRRK